MKALLTALEGKVIMSIPILNQGATAGEGSEYLVEMYRFTCKYIQDQMPEKWVFFFKKFAVQCSSF